MSDEYEEGLGDVGRIVEEGEEECGWDMNDWLEQVAQENRRRIEEDKAKEEAENAKYELKVLKKEVEKIRRQAARENSFHEEVQNKVLQLKIAQNTQASTICNALNRLESRVPEGKKEMRLVKEEIKKLNVLFADFLKDMKQLVGESKREIDVSTLQGIL